ncbi:MAG: apolipoprotein N-acyltransferase [Sphingobacteriales bacterium]|nr:apolipoprotein N-acyltransferase [Sphingobacteriales bacterium]
MNSSKYSNLISAAVSGVLLWAAWPTSPLTFLIFIARLPLLSIAERGTGWKKFLGYQFLTLLIWNVLTTWWVANSTLIGGMMAFLVNSILMSIPWMVYFFTKKRFNTFWGSVAFISYWITFEYLHQNWDLSWPWLTLGNAFATHPDWVQWYEYTGTTGGTLWVLVANLIMFNAFRLYRIEGRSTQYFKNILAFILVLCFPIFLSWLVSKKSLTVAHNKYNVVVVQPNIDTWDVKFEAGKEEAQIHKMISLSESQVDAQTALVVWPETAIPFSVDESRMKEDFRLHPIFSFLRNHAQVNLVTGLVGYNTFASKMSIYARPFPDGSGYFETYNSAALIDSSKISFYHKSKLVPGVESLPGFLNFMAPLFEKFGGTTSTYARNDEAKDLATTNNSFVIAPAICYESVFGEYVSNFSKLNADLICIMTNDGWWKNTQGYKQHMSYARLRAVENRKWVARSANTGISCFIDPYGNVVQQLGWDKEGALKQEVAAFTGKTFFAKHGDILSKLFSVLTVVFVGIAIFKRLKD